VPALRYRRRAAPLFGALFVLGCSLHTSCNSDSAPGNGSRATPALSTQLAGRAAGPPSASAEPEATSPPSAIEPKAEYTIEEERCKRNEPDCLPEPYNGREDMIVGTLGGIPYKYKAGSKRYPLPYATESEGECEHDGDCIARLSCVECTSRFRVPPQRQCPALYLGQFDGALCGCVEKRCRWFTQRLTERVVSSTENLEVRLAGAPLTDKKFFSEAAKFFDVDLADCYYRHKGLLPARHSFVMNVGKYGETEIVVSGAPPAVRKCVSDTFDALTKDLNWISDNVLEHGEIRFSGVTVVKMTWVP